MKKLSFTTWIAVVLGVVIVILAILSFVFFNLPEALIYFHLA